MATGLETKVKFLEQRIEALEAKVRSLSIKTGPFTKTGRMALHPTKGPVNTKDFKKMRK